MEAVVEETQFEESRVEHWLRWGVELAGWGEEEAQEESRDGSGRHGRWRVVELDQEADASTEEGLGTFSELFVR